MRIDTLTIKNFKKYAEQTFELNPRFNLLIGDNGSGKTTILDALAVAAGVWLLDVPDPQISNSQCNLSPLDVRQEPRQEGDRVQFHPQLPVAVSAKGIICETSCEWVRVLEKAKTKDKSGGVKALIRQCYQRAASGEQVLLPIIAYYGAGRAWLPSYQRSGPKKGTANLFARRWAAFYDCLNERLRLPDIKAWFKNEAVERLDRNGRWRPGFHAVCWALRQCVPGLSELGFNFNEEQMVINIRNQSQLFDHLSAGQRMMVALVADIAIKMVTQNVHLIPAEDTDYADDTPPPVLRETPGLVLIDELDVHLHPSWQREIVSALKRAFPSIQFVCTTHSPQLIGELQTDEIILLSDTGLPRQPTRSFGLDANHVLNEIMGAPLRNATFNRELETLFSLIENGDLDGATQQKEAIARWLGRGDDPELLRAETLISFLGTPLTEG